MRGRLWLLESGTGSLGTVDLNTGKYEPIVRLDGFTRGLEMVGNLAFIGLSQVRETAIFSGIQITERLQETERTCGVWVVDIQRGQVVAFLKFEEAVQEIFAVALLPGMRFPDLINDNTELVGSSFVLPDDALRDVPAELRARTLNELSARRLSYLTFTVDCRAIAGVHPGRVTMSLRKQTSFSGEDLVTMSRPLSRRSLCA